MPELANCMYYWKLFGLNRPPEFLEIALFMAVFKAITSTFDTNINLHQLVCQYGDKTL